MSNLRMCSRCKSNIDVSHFSMNRKKQLYKTCNSCRNPKKENEPSDLENINKAREEFIKSIINEFDGIANEFNGNANIKYIRQIKQNDYLYPNEEMPPIKGDEKIIEYHLFTVGGLNLPIIYRWRLR